MPPDLQDPQLADMRRHAADVITRTQEDAMQQLFQAGLPETDALTAMSRINTFCLQALRELDTLFRQFDELVTTAERTPEHQAWFNDKAAAILLQAQTACATLVAETIQKAIQTYRNPPAPRQEVIPTVSAAPRQASRGRSLPIPNFGKLLLLFLLVHSLGGWFLLWWHVSTTHIWAVIATGMTVVLLAVFPWAGVVVGIIVGMVCAILLA
jgi:hypothetical protein